VGDLVELSRCSQSAVSSDPPRLARRSDARSHQPSPDIRRKVLVPFAAKFLRGRPSVKALRRVAQSMENMAKNEDSLPLCPTTITAVAKCAQELRSAFAAQSLTGHVTALVTAASAAIDLPDDFANMSVPSGELVEEMVEGSRYSKPLRKRMEHNLKAMTANPTASTPQQFKDDDAGLAGFYRFVDHHRVTLAKTLEPHIRATVKRARAAGVVLAVHDTTEMAFGHGTTRTGLGRLDGGIQGFLGHTCLGVSADGKRTPLGVLGFRSLIRVDTVHRASSALERYQDPDKEFRRWKELVIEVRALGLDAENVIHLMDREGDDYDLLVCLAEGETRSVVRMNHNRLLFQGDETPEGMRKVHDLFKDAVGVCERAVPLTARGSNRPPHATKVHPPRNQRIATLHFAARAVVLRRPDNAPKDLPASLKRNVVRVWEPDPPPGEDPVVWFLVTGEPIDTVEQILAIVDYYRARWVIEEYFKALKTGCSYERRQLETADHLLNALGLFLPIAVQLLRLRSAARDDPTAPATEFLTPLQLEVLRASVRRPLSPAPTIGEAMHAVAAIGGHLKRNGEPGWQVLWRGYHRLQVLTEGWLLAERHRAKAQPPPDCPGDDPVLPGPS